MQIKTKDEKKKKLFRLRSNSSISPLSFEVIIVDMDIF